MYHLQRAVWQQTKWETCTHGLIDALAEDGEDEDGRHGGREVAGDGLDVVKELTALRRLHDGDPRYAHPNQNQDEDSTRTNKRGDEAQRETPIDLNR